MANNCLSVLMKNLNVNRSNKDAFNYGNDRCMRYAYWY